jgi:hypothetical protein
VKTDRRDVELLARNLLAGSLVSRLVRAPEVEAALSLPGCTTRVVAI